MTPPLATGDPGERLRANPLSQRIARSLRAEVVGSAWFVGGAVRDALLGAATSDIDVVVSGDVAAAARRLAADADAHPFELHGDPATWRVSARDGTWYLDLVGLRAASIEADLARRDFTINALALPIDSEGGALIDPLDGAADLAAGLLRAASPDSFRDDPLRIMRAARFASALGLKIDPGTAAAARAEAARADQPAGERKFAELRAIIAGPDPIVGLAELDRLGVTPRVLPELAALRGVGQNTNHHLDVHDHTIEVMRQWLAIEADLAAYVGDELAEPVAALLAEPLADQLDRRVAIRFGALLHDIAKPLTRTVEGGMVRFFGHDRIGAEMITALCRRLGTSRRFRVHEADLARHHLVLGFMVERRPLPRRALWGYLALTGAAALDVTLLTIADRLAARGSRVGEAAIAGHLELARQILAEAVASERDGAADPLLDSGEILQALAIEPGPLLGEAIVELAAAQWCGELADSAAARAHLVGWLARRTAEQSLR